MTLEERELFNTISKRFQILWIIERGTTNKREIVATADVSRPTVDRALRELERNEIVRRRGSICELTYFGKVVLKEYTSTIEVFKRLTTSRDLLSSLPGDCGLDLRLLNDAEITPSPEYAPHEPLKDIEFHFRTAKFVWNISTIVLLMWVNIFRTQINEGTNMDVLLGPCAYNSLIDNYQNSLSVVIDSSHCTLRRLRNNPQFGLFLFDNSIVYVTFFESDGKLNGVLSNKTDAAVECAREIFTDWRARSIIVDRDSVV
jgi:predicted transcriptional regulator